jgi:hypothetical protein
MMKLHPAFLATAIAGTFALACPAEALAQAAAAKPTATQPAAAKQRTFPSPNAAAEALADAVKANDVAALIAVVGPGSESWLFSGDKVADANDWKKFLSAYQERNAVRKDSDDKAILEVGSDDWPFPAPLVKKGTTWSFDANAGREEIINRRVGRNELDTMQTLLAIVDAQREYAATDADKNGYADYARRFRSSEGKRDGLYWPEGAGAPQSPLGPLVAVAAKEGYGKSSATVNASPYHGYHYRILTAQGSHATGGAYDYLVGDKLLGGFAVIAYPASYGVSGVATFLVNHDGVVFEKDLGPKTPSIATSMKRFDPDTTWRKAP